MLEFVVEHAREIGLLFFVTTFGVVLLCVFRPGAKKRLESLKNIPFEGE